MFCITIMNNLTHRKQSQSLLPSLPPSYSSSLKKLVEKESEGEDGVFLHCQDCLHLSPTPCHTSCLSTWPSFFCLTSIASFCDLTVRRRAYKFRSVFCLSRVLWPPLSAPRPSYGAPPQKRVSHIHAQSYTHTQSNTHTSLHSIHIRHTYKAYISPTQILKLHYEISACMLGGDQALWYRPQAPFESGRTHSSSSLTS